MTKQEMYSLKIGQTITHKSLTNSDGTPQRFKVTSLTFWKRDKARFAIGLKRGLKEFHKITTKHDLLEFNINSNS